MKEQMILALTNSAISLGLTVKPQWQNMTDSELVRETCIMLQAVANHVTFMRALSKVS